VWERMMVMTGGAEGSQNFHPFSISRLSPMECRNCIRGSWPITPSASHRERSWRPSGPI
jgi:hypothetical protein